jgi:hypothetical protein
MFCYMDVRSGHYWKTVEWNKYDWMYSEEDIFRWQQKIESGAKRRGKKWTSLQKMEAFDGVAMLRKQNGEDYCKMSCPAQDKEE